MANKEVRKSLRRRCCDACGWTLTSIIIAVFAVQIAFKTPSLETPPDVSVSLDDNGWERKLRGNLANHGYAHVMGLLNRTETEALRDLAYTYCYGQTRKALPLTWGGYSIPAFIDLPEFSNARWLLDDPRLHRMLKGVFDGAEYRFASHNDIGCDFVGVWHKDILRGPQRKYQVHDMWTPDEAGEQHQIYKVLFYLQDHRDDTRSVKVVPGSHMLREISLERGYTAAHPGLGDAIVIDQRISHAGNSFYDPFSQGRIFVQLGFGKANIFTDEFERGTTERQSGYQAKMLQKSQEKGLSTMMIDAKFTVIGLVFCMLPPGLLNALADIDVKKYAILGRLIFGNNAATSK